MSKNESLFQKKPSWLKVKIPQGKRYQQILEKRKTLSLATVCEEANCPNIGECWSSGTATFMLMGDTCTRSCRFCSIRTNRKPGELDPEEPQKLANTIAAMKLDYIVLTSVDRDDLDDQGSKHIHTCIKKIQKENPNLLLEILSPDFQGNQSMIAEVLNSRPAVFAHNVETVKRLTSCVRDRRTSYLQSLEVLSYSKKYAPSIYTKSSIMVGLSETKEEVIQTMKDLIDHEVDFLTIGQYLQPNKALLSVKQFIRPELFKEYEEIGLNLGFRYVASGPLVRSSYKAAEHFITALLHSQKSA